MGGKHLNGGRHDVLELKVRSPLTARQLARAAILLTQQPSHPLWRENTGDNPFARWLKYIAARKLGLLSIQEWLDLFAEESGLDTSVEFIALKEMLNSPSNTSW